MADCGRTVLLVTATQREAEDLTATVGAFFGPDQVVDYPAWETLPHERLSPRSDTVGKRLTVLRRLAGTDELPAPRVIVAPVRSILQPQVKGLANLRPVTVRAGAEYELEQLARDLVDAAYIRVDLVERRGEFAVRGGIVDIFPPTAEHPVRIDFFGDEVDEIRPFTVADQRSGDELLDEITATPCRELLITDAVKQRAADLADRHPQLADMLERIARGHAVDGMEALSAVLVDGMELFTDVLPDDALVIIGNPELVSTRAGDLVRTSEEFRQSSWAGAAAGGSAPIDLAESAFHDLADVRGSVLDRGLGWWSFSQFSAAPDEDAADDPAPEDRLVPEVLSDAGAVESRTIEATGIDGWRGQAEDAIGEIGASLADGWAVVLVAEGRGIADRMGEVLGDHDIGVRRTDELPDAPEPSVATVVAGALRHGFRLPRAKLAVWTAAELSGQRPVDRSARTMPARRRNQINPLELQPGDPVVHEQHGVGRYLEMVHRQAAGTTREYLVIEYAASKRGQPRDRLFVPMDQLDLVTRYIGGEAPTLDKMGGADWTKRKSRARKAVREIAGELIKLYAARQATRGHAFGPDNPWQRELEDAFSYAETPDQLAAIDDVKADMEQVVPMDRLICGDVGYGKTEIAVRAAFKAVQDGKQVAVLVPTTLLVQQHEQTFAGRYAGFPVNVAALSRFQTDAEAKKVLAGLTDGTVDVVIGTHRLLGSEVRFKDLGLVIVDEEQRFGVEHKEQLKQMRTHVDVLTLSATPIPRTLEMAVTGIREMSTIATPPEERHPVLTFVGAYDEAQVTAAIRRELLREGQVFYIHNRVQSIDKVAAKIRELVPEARVVTAHGQMGEKRLEQVMVDFWERKADVLVCTTIVESGLDISTANTLLIERADMFGLSQLHQLRGRVGRGRERGYAYFLYPPDKPLSETAHDRLATLAQHTDIGAGMAIAMKDLEIRGAGNLLGGEQSGHIADVGFDLYIRLVGEAVTEYRSDGSEAEPEPEVRIELPIDAHLPTDYVESERLRLEVYKRIAEVRSEDDITAIAEELTDRYGTPPKPVTALLDVARFRLAARAAGLTEVVAQGSNIRFGPVDLPESRQLRLARLHPSAVVKAATRTLLVPRPMTAPMGGRPVVDAELLEWCSAVVSDIIAPAPVPAR
ncbi:MAG: transcription-repair coupling factor [Propionibacterium sp.]|nr:transcription-repair coupling factor [Propionibacterium sp.]